MIINCLQCGHYKVSLGAEIEGARTMIKKLRLDLKNPATSEAVKSQVKDITRLAFEIGLLLYSVEHGDAPWAYEVLGIEPAEERACQCGYPSTPCDKKKHDYGHDCVEANIKAPVAT